MLKPRLVQCGARHPPPNHPTTHNPSTPPLSPPLTPSTLPPNPKQTPRRAPRPWPDLPATTTITTTSTNSSRWSGQRLWQVNKLSTLPTGEILLRTLLSISVALENSPGERAKSFRIIRSEAVREKKDQRHLHRHLHHHHHHHHLQTQSPHFIIGKSYEK
ncbi:hypothetical protein E2C01_068830 [Portunus trituberculatus]|uniref:Uncharacterized protein n=1 Tax=Portunus trituberculatus TaxID=210409 RepID=A0A5B7HT25_PORTR|nr:hypothetical protein [Portunus trituberculatus]